MQPVIRLIVAVRAFTGAGGRGLTRLPSGSRQADRPKAAAIARDRRVGRRRASAIAGRGEAARGHAVDRPAHLRAGARSGRNESRRWPTRDPSPRRECGGRARSPSLSSQSTKGGRSPRGSRAQRRARQRAPSAVEEQAERGQQRVSAPYFARRCRPRRALPAILQAATWAWRSPMNTSGMRTFCRSTAGQRRRRTRPHAAQRTAGRRTPFLEDLRRRPSAPTPAARPPTSWWCVIVGGEGERVPGRRP